MPKPISWDRLSQLISRLPPEVRKEEAVIVDVNTDEYLPVLLGTDEEGGWPAEEEGEADEPMHKHAFLHRICDRLETEDVLKIEDDNDRPTTHTST
jgi:hypothetical protein